MRDLEADLARQAAEVPGFSPGAHVVAVPAETTEAGWQELVRITSQRPSPVSHQLARAFVEAQGERRDFVVGGPHAALADRVLRDGLALAPAGRLLGLRVLFLSPEPPSDELQEVAMDLGVQLVYRPLEAVAPRER